MENWGGGFTGQLTSAHKRDQQKFRSQARQEERADTKSHLLVSMTHRYRNIGTQVHRHTQTHRYGDTHRYTQTHRHTGIQAHRYTQRYTSV